MDPELVKAIAAVIAALGSAAWPVVTLVLMLWYRPQVAALVSRLKKGKFLGQEIELKELDVLDAKAQAAAAASPPAPPKALPPKLEQPALLPPKTESPAQLEDRTQKFERQVLEEASRKPRVALILLSTEIEREIRRRLAGRGQLEENRTYPISHSLRALHGVSGIPEAVAAAFEQFSQVRNRIIHGRRATDEEAIRAIDSGLVIYRSIARLPATRHKVHKTDVPIFMDPACSKPHEGVAVILESIGHGAEAGSFQIFPTTRTHFKEGQEVAWEWDLSKTWNDAWYRDPDTGKIKSAWSSAGEFVGRHLDDL